MLPYNDHILSSAAIFQGKPTGRFWIYSIYSYSIYYRYPHTIFNWNKYYWYTEAATFKLCIAINTSIEILSACNDSWLRSERLQLPTGISTRNAKKPLKITAVCNIALNKMLIGDNSGRIHCFEYVLNYFAFSSRIYHIFLLNFSLKENKSTFTYALDAAQSSAIISISHGNDTSIAIVGMANNRIIILNLNCKSNNSTNEIIDKLIIAETYMNSQLCGICVHSTTKYVFV